MNEITAAISGTIVFGVDVSADYEGGGVVAVFSTKTKALAYQRKLKLSAVESSVIYEMKIDHPKYESKYSNYKRK